MSDDLLLPIDCLHEGLQVTDDNHPLVCSPDPLMDTSAPRMLETPYMHGAVSAYDLCSSPHPTLNHL